MNCEDIQQKLH